MAKIEIPLVAELPASTPAAGKAKKTNRDLETPSFEPSSQKRSVKKEKKEPSSESEEVEESTEETGSSTKLEEEAEPAILPLEKKRTMNIRASDKKKPGPDF